MDNKLVVRASRVSYAQTMERISRTITFLSCLVITFLGCCQAHLPTCPHGLINQNSTYQSDRFQSPSSQQKELTCEATGTSCSEARSAQEKLKYLRSFDVIKDVLNKLDSFHGQLPIAELTLAGLYTQMQTTEYSYMSMHRYDSFDDLKQATSPAQADQQKCIRQLEELNERLQAQSSHKRMSTDLNAYQLLDTFGRLPSGELLGNFFWTGTHGECLRLKIHSQDGTKVSTRYCVAHAKHPAWPDQIDVDTISYQLGVCLPESCDSTNYKNKFELVTSLVNFNSRDLEKGQLEVAGLYCLPDESSPARSIWARPITWITLLAATCWISLLIYATAIDLVHGKSEDIALENKSEATVASVWLRVRVLRSLSIANNLTKLFDISDRKSQVNAAETNSNSAKSEDKIVDFSLFEGIKVIAMCYVIMGHVLMVITGGIVDGRQLSSNPAFKVANLMPAFAVNSFFVITGILTCYLLFKQHQSKAFMTRPSNWLAVIVFRYNRIMPMYLLAVLYSKAIAKYTNSGPIWDYGTSDSSQRRTCEQESWLWALLFAANFKKPLDHCIPGAWYLANDFQFFLVTPLFLLLLLKLPKFGRRFLFTCIGLGYFASVMSILTADTVDDLRPIALFAPHAFKLYHSNLHFNYTRPQYRIPPFLCGLYIGYLLFEYEQANLRFRSNRCVKQQGQGQVDEQEPDWPEAFKRYSLPLSLAIVSLFAAVPFIASHLHIGKHAARVVVAVFNPTIHLLFSLAIGLFILSQSTAARNRKTLIARLLSAPQWKPLSRLSLCNLLINVEVILYIVQGRTHLHPLTNQYLWAINLLAIVMTYCVSAVVCVTVEVPLRAMTWLMLSLVASNSCHQSERSHYKKTDSSAEAST